MSDWSTFPFTQYAETAPLEMPEVLPILVTTGPVNVSPASRQEHGRSRSRVAPRGGSGGAGGSQSRLKNASVKVSPRSDPA